MGSATARRPPRLFCLAAALALPTPAALAQTAPAPGIAPATAPAPARQRGVVVRLGGEYRLRVNMMSDIPLRPLPRTDPAASGQLGQRLWGEQWLRLRSDVAVTPDLHIIGQMDVLHGVAFGDLAQGVTPEARLREDHGYPGVRLRWLYLDWETPIGLLRVGQMGFSWGLGMVANDGDTPTVFGDYMYGDIVRRVMLATRPLGRATPFVVAVGGDQVVRDQLADFDRRDELAFQGIVASYYGDGANRVGGYGVYRWQENPLGDSLSAFFVDVFARWGFNDSAGGRIYGAIEAAYASGSTTYARTVERPEQSVRQLLAVLQVGRTSPKLDVVLEGGYASGDANTEDAIQGRATIDPDHRVGLILFPEVMAAQSARSAYLAQSPALGARPARGSELLPTNGGVSGAAYLFPYAIYRPRPWIELRLGGVFALATADVVDPFAQRAYSRAENAQGGPSTARDLGVEVDGAVLLQRTLTRELVLSGGVEGGVFVAGSAFDDAAGRALGPLGLVRLRVGLRFR